ncbi:MAG TPA: zf-TFIIB domain-containing protein [Methylomirabilota bacterium]|nr:zf-TFIIB domain-containing protein [Methylomirabilota bacterium]
MTGPATVPPLSCPGCEGPMDACRLDAHYGRSVELDVCHGCGLIWFDGRESIALTPGAVLHLFAALDAHRERRHPLQRDTMTCPRCRRRLAPTVDRQRAITFAYWRCPAEDGRLTTFFDFLREKNFVRPLSPERLAELRAYARTVNCSACGAAIDLARESACPHCRAPLSMLDPDQVQKVVGELQRAEERRTTVDPALPARLVTDRASIERAFRRVPGEVQRLDLGASFGLVESGISALVRLLSAPPSS